MKRTRKWSALRLFGVALFALTAVVIGSVAWQSLGRSPGGGNGDLPSLYNLTDVEFSEFRGNVVVVDLFATWCGPCKSQIPHLAQIREKYSESEVAVLSVGSSSDSESALRQFKRDFNMLWPVARDTVGVFDEFDVYGIPTIVILDESGNVYFRHVGLIDAVMISVKIDELLSN